MRFNGGSYPDPLPHGWAGVDRPILVTAAGVTTAAFPLTPARTLFASVRPHALLITNLVDSNADLAFIAREPGAPGDDVSIAYVVSGNNTALSVAVSAKAITVHVETDGSANAVSTGAEVLAAIIASDLAEDLVAAQLAPGSDGTGVVEALAATNLADWAADSDATLKFEQSIDNSTFLAYSASALATLDSIADTPVPLILGPLGVWGRWVFLGVDGGANPTPIGALSIVATYY